MTCQQCAAPVAAGQRFCRECGAAVQPAASPPQAALAQPMAIHSCPACAKPFAAGQRFCRSCGTPLGAPPVAQPAPQGQQARLGDHANTFVPALGDDEDILWLSDEVTGRCEVCAAPTASGMAMCAACSGDLPGAAGGADSAANGPAQEDTMVGLYARSVSPEASPTPDSSSQPQPQPQAPEAPGSGPVGATAADLRAQSPSAEGGRHPLVRRLEDARMRLAAQPRRRLIAGGGAAAAVLLVVVVGAVLLIGDDSSEPDQAARVPVTGSTDSTTPTGTVRAHWEAVAGGDYPSAYAQLAPDFREDSSLEGWTGDLRSKDPRVNLVRVEYLRALDSESAEVAVEVVSRNADDQECLRRDGRVRVVKANDLWRYSPGREGDTFTRRESLPGTDARCAPLR